MQPALSALMDLAHDEWGKGLSAPLPLKGDGSDRQIYRFTRGDQSWIGVTNPDRRENEAFLLLTQHFLALGLPVPRIYRHDLLHDCYLMEDLGALTLADCLEAWNAAVPPQSEAIMQAYRQVLQWLPRFQLQGHQGLDYRFCYLEKELDETGFLRDVEYFRRYFWELFAGSTPQPPEVLEELQQLARLIGHLPRDSFVYRDFQSRNIMWKEEHPVFIDYQSGCLGAIHYDVATVLYASKAGLAPEMREPLIAAYVEALQPWRKLTLEEFLSHFYQFVLIRRLRSLGTYGFLPSQKGKFYFLKAIPATLQEIAGLLHDQPSLGGWRNLRRLFDRWREDTRLNDPLWLEARAREILSSGGQG